MPQANSRRILAVDIGGSHVKVLISGEQEPRKAESGADFGPRELVAKVKELAEGWPFDVISLGYPGKVLEGRIVDEPANLKHGWVNFDFEAEFGCPVRIMNDAAMQALGCYEGQRMLFLGLGTGLGSALIVDGHIVPLSLGDLPFRRRGNMDYYLNRAAIKRQGRKRWEKAVLKAVPTLQKAMEADYVVLGGGQADELKEVPAGTRRGSNLNAFIGGFRMWDAQYGR